MDPEIQRALNEGVPPSVIAAELQKRGLPVPQELAAMSTQPPQAQRPDALPPTPTDSKIGLGTLGALGAGTLTAGAGAANYAFNPNLRAQRFLQKAVTESGGPDALKSMLRQYQANGRGDLVTLGDLSKRMGAVTDFTATNSPAARAKLSDIHDARQQGVPQRLIGDVTGEIGPQAPNVEIQRLHDAQQAFAAGPQGYEGLRQRNPVIAPQAAGELHSFVTSPKLRSVWKQAADVGVTGPMPAADKLSFEVLQDMKERLDDGVGAAFKQGRGGLAVRLKTARDHLVETMGNAIPEYKPVAQQYHAYSKAQEMLQAGQDSWTAPMQQADLDELVKTLSPQELDYFRRGMGGAALRDLENAQTNTNVARQMRAKGQVYEKKLETVFGSQQKFLAFKTKLDLESKMADMGSHIGGASTARRLGAQADVADQALEAGDAMMHPLSTVGKVVKDAPKYFAGYVANRLEDKMTAQGYSELMGILRSLR